MSVLAVTRSALTLPMDVLHAETEPLSNQLPAAVVAAVLPITLTSLLIAAVVTVRGPGTQISQTIVDTAYGLSGMVVLAGLYRHLDRAGRSAAIPISWPTRMELLWTAVCLPLAVGAFLLGATLGESLGFGLAGFDYSLSDPGTLVAIIFGAIIVAPFAEEVLFRGFLLGSLLGRGRSPATAGAVTILLFAGIHIISLGVAGVLAIAGWAIFPTLLRLKFNNLAGAWLLHLCNNIWAYLIVVALGLA